MVDNGGLHSLPHPVDWYADHHIVANYKYMVNAIAMFNAQMSIRCIDIFPEIYGRVDDVPHPLLGRQNWTTMHRTYLHQTEVGDDDTTWTAVMKHATSAFKPTAKSIKPWMEKMDEKLRALIMAEVNPVTVDTVVLGFVLGKFP